MKIPSFLYSKRADISFTMIVVAIIALLVLVVVIMIFVNRVSDVNEGFSDCQVRGGQCYDSADQCNAGTVADPTSCAKGQYCCIPILNQKQP